MDQHRPTRDGASGGGWWSLGAVRRRPLLVGELLVTLGLVKVYDLARGLAQVRSATAVRDGRGILRAEAWLHLDIERALNALASRHRLLELAAVYWYQLAHLSVSLTVLAWCYLARPEAYRWARTALLTINLVALAVFLLLPVAPPRLLPGAGFVDSAVQVGFVDGPVGPVAADQYGAMPSLHIAWAVWVAVVLAATVRTSWLRRAWAVYPFVTAAAVVLTANHYLADIVAGGVVTLLCVTFSTALRPTQAEVEPVANQLTAPSSRA